MGCNCNGSAGAPGEEYGVVAGDGTALPVSGTSMGGTLEQARAAASAAGGGAWVKKRATA